MVSKNDDTTTENNDNSQQQQIMSTMTENAQIVPTPTVQAINWDFTNTLYLEITQKYFKVMLSKN